MPLPDARHRSSPANTLQQLARLGQPSQYVRTNRFWRTRLPATDAPSLTERLAAHCARPIDAATRTRARLHLLDWLGCVAGGINTDMGRVVRSATPDPIERAALLGNVLEMDDVHRAALLHPGPVVWSAALAAPGEPTMGAVLDAGVRGYEAMIGVGATFDAHHYAHFHPTATAGSFGAAVAAAAIVGAFGPGRLHGDFAGYAAGAMGHAGSVAGGLWQVRHEPGALTKSYHVLEVAARASRIASFAARSPAPRFILEGPQGLYAATCTAPQPGQLLGPAGHWRIHDVSFKPHPACRHAHPVIDAALALRAQGALGPQPVRVETYADALRFCDKPEPRTAGEAKFSLQHAVAVVAVRGQPSLADFEPDAIADPALAAARALVSVAESTEFTARYPRHFGARVTAGKQAVEVTDALGDPELPMDADAIIAKVRALVNWGGLPGKEADRAIRLALHSDDDKPAAKLARLLGRWLDD